MSAKKGERLLKISLNMKFLTLLKRGKRPPSTVLGKGGALPKERVLLGISISEKEKKN